MKERLGRRQGQEMAALWEKIFETKQLCVQRPGQGACLAGSRHREGASSAGGWQGARKAGLVGMSWDPDP